jgi:AraC-like DNA-binding protein
LCGGVHHCDPSWDKPADGLDRCYKLYFVTRGEGRVTLRTQDVVLRAGHAVFIPGYQIVRQQCPRRMDVYWVHFLPESLYLSFLMSHIAQVHTWPLAALAHWQPTYERLPRLFGEPLPWLGYRVQALLLYLTSEVLESYNLSHMAAVDPVFEQLRPAIAYMEESLLENPSLAEVARVVHLAPNYFHRRFTGTFFVTPFAYMLQRRLDIARQLLLGTNLPLPHVAERSGFHSQFYFSRMFKKHYGLSPTEFRARPRP